VLAHVRLVAHECVGTGFGLLIFSMEEILRGEGGGSELDFFVFSVFPKNLDFSGK
jgi:hypothetical protein